MSKKIYAVDSQELHGIAKHLKRLDKLEDKSSQDVAVLVLPDKIEIVDVNEDLIGYAVFIDGYWAFEAVTENRRRKRNA